MKKQDSANVKEKKISFIRLRLEENVENEDISGEEKGKGKTSE